MGRPLPLELVLSGRDITEPRPSPDGARVGYVRRWRGASELLAVSIRGGPSTPLTFGPDPAAGRGLGGGCFDWLPDGSGVVYVAIDGELWLARGATCRRLTTFDRTCRAPVVAIVVEPASNAAADQRATQAEHAARPDHDPPGRMVVVVSLDDGEVWMVPLDGDSPPRRLDDGRHEFCFDPAVSPDGTVVSWVGWSPPSMAWDAGERVDVVLGGAPDGGDVHSSWKPLDGAVSEPRFARDGTATHVHDGAGWRNVYVGGRPVVVESVEHAGPTWGMGNRSYDVGVGGVAVITRNVGGAGQLLVVYPDGESSVVDDDHVWGQVSIVGDLVVGVRSAPSRPPEIAVVDVGPTARHDNATVLAVSGVDAWRAVQPSRIEMLDTTIPARRVVPADDVRATLCWIHGGPTDQWRNDFRPRLDYWTSRGFQIVIPDHRGSTGYGRAFQQALHGGWGRTDVDDIAAVLAELHLAGTTSAATTVIVGGSSGGGAVLGVLADHPQLVAGGIASYPVSDLADLAERSHRLEAHYTDTLVGPASDVAAFQRLSVIHRAGQITKPLLVFHGSDDPVVPAEHTEALVAAIGHNGHGDCVEHVVYEGEGHGFRDPANVADEYARMAAFLERVIPLPDGGR
ncbi:MAG: S9 family peptidase [Ilumatobacteraceae bacterium]|nr:S9 family peptidase [Ilumatobacteraceae bacterium]